MRVLLLVVALAVSGAVGVAPAPTKRTGGLKPKLQNLVDKLGEIKAPAPVMHEKLEHAKLTKPT